MVFKIVFHFEFSDIPDKAGRKARRRRKRRRTQEIAKSYTFHANTINHIEKKIDVDRLKGGQKNS